MEDGEQMTDNKTIFKLVIDNSLKIACHPYPPAGGEGWEN